MATEAQIEFPRTASARRPLRLIGGGLALLLGLRWVPNLVVVEWFILRRHAGVTNQRTV